ncbi:MoxR-like ATPase [Arcobacter venerupis]|uniref:MoxR-like ATPase n=1 Tax=Arcobacter venerupis TaxID=1054033 RepID=A0AAE7B9V7_9BACT|nr:AAA family ATPase [Arcobacter venerupis]QKF68024.1 MoxR-like ATPase [Arcobacter venerupis]RWS48778.1 ATPase [Arcobacter venerupis]
MNNLIQNIKNEMKKVIVGQEELIDSLLIGLIANGHILVEGVPGLAKTTAINALAQALGIEFKRIQFTPDLLPSDITGTEIYNPKSGEFSIKKGPAFTNLLLADEINRAPAKVQAALLEVMQERQITISDTTFKSPSPFLVMATENPVEQEGTYRLPEAQLDRFMMKVLVGYNTFDEEMEIVNRVAIKGFEQIQVVASVDDIINMKESLKEIHVDTAVKNYMTKLIFSTRDPKDYDLHEIAEYIEFGASPRASIDLYKASIATALIRGKDYVTPLDISYVLKGVLRHRLILNFKARANGITTDYIIEKIIQKIKTP